MCQPKRTIMNATKSCRWLVVVAGLLLAGCISQENEEDNYASYGFFEHLPALAQLSGEYEWQGATPDDEPLYLYIFGEDPAAENEDFWLFFQPYPLACLVPGEQEEYSLAKGFVLPADQDDPGRYYLHFYYNTNGKKYGSSFYIRTHDGAPVLIFSDASSDKCDEGVVYRRTEVMTEELHKACMINRQSQAHTE